MTPPLEMIDDVKIDPNQIPLQSKEKIFNIKLKNGPINFKYFYNGKETILYSNDGYLAYFDIKKLNCFYEHQLNDKIHDVSILAFDHVAVAQSKSLFIYNRNGMEIHRLPYFSKALVYMTDHYLLGSLNPSSISYLDITNGREISNIKTGRNYDYKTGNTNSINHKKGVLFVGDQKGIISLYTPNNKEYVAKVLCHRNDIKEIKLLNNYLISRSLSDIKTWDIRKMNTPINVIKGYYKTFDVSRNEILAAGNNSRIFLFDLKENKNLIQSKKSVQNRQINQVGFCLFDDILTIGKEKGLQTICIPCTGIAEFDSRDFNPWLSKKERRELEMNKLLERIPADLIGHDLFGKDVIYTNHTREETKEEKETNTFLKKLLNN